MASQDDGDYDERRNSLELADVDLDDSRLGEPPIPSDFNVKREKPRAILSKGIIGCIVSCCCVIPVAIALFFVVLITTFLLYGPYRADFTMKEHHSPKVIHGQLSNGLKYAIRKNQVKQGKFSTFLQVNTGSSNEEQNERGISHMMEHMAFDNSKEFQGRGGVWRQIFNAGLGYFNAYTSFRNTVYMFLDVIVDTSNPTTSLRRIMNIFYNQVQNSEVIEQYLNIEKGAVLGESRMRTSSMAIALERALENHSGGAWRVGSRFPIGTEANITSWKASDLQNYYTKWYRLDKMILFVVGDIDPTVIEQAVKEFWEPKKLLSGQQQETVPNKPTGTPKPVEKFVMTEVDGINGINFNLLITEPYVGYPRDVNYHREEFGNDIFTYVYTIQVLMKILTEYPGTTLDDFTTRNAAIASFNQYMFGSRLTIGTFLTPGPRPNSGTWRRDLTIYVQELHGLAEDGPSSYTILAMQFLFSILSQVDDTKLDSTDLITLLLGDEDPDQIYLDSNQQAAMMSQFVGVGFNDYFVKHVQSQAQFMFNALFDLVNEDQQTVEKPYPHIVDVPQASMNIFIGRNEIPYGIDGITEQDVKEHLKAVIAAPNPGSSLLEGLGGDYSGLGSFGGIFDPIEPRPPASTFVPKLIDSDDKSGVRIFELRNGIRVNIKANDADTSSPSGYSRMQVVSLGGKSTQPPELKGACDFVNAAEPVGFRYYYEDKEYRFGSGGGLINCENDYMVIDVQLHGPCASSNALCSVNTFNFTDEIEQAILTMHPIYNNLAVEKVVKNWEKKEKLIETTNDPLSYLTAGAIPEAIEKTFKDPRFASVSEDDIERLHPIAVQYWVSNQFQPDRMEINVIGDLDNSVLLEDLDRWFGSIPKKIPVGQKVGYDIYSPADATHFAVKFPENKTVEHSCNLPNVAPDRGFVVSVFPAPTPYDASYPAISAVDNMLGSYFFDVIRSKHGFSYFASVSVKRSALLPDTSSYSVIWCTGNYPAPNASDPINIVASQNTASHAIRSTVPERIFNDDKAAYLGELSSVTQIADFYLTVLRGLSLKAPVWKGSGYLKKIRDIDLEAQVKQITYDSVKDLMASRVNSVNSEIRVNVATVPLDTKNRDAICSL